MENQSAQIHVRGPNLDDTDFILAAWDSTLPFLASIGAGEMWGDEPFSLREGQKQETIEIIRRSEGDPQDDSRRLLVAEVTATTDGIAGAAPVGAAIIRDVMPYYLLERPELKGEVDKADSLLFIEVLITDHRVDRQHRGAGAALVEAIKRRAIWKGKSAVYVDAWAGNGRKLNKYYESLGFENVGDYSLTRRNGSIWPGTLYRFGLEAVNTVFSTAVADFENEHVRLS
ncbi:hypothetical protein F4678DRAFT_113800 [Xylaria arbuscula]|nr:hypothetical protein F4678DRAFT_113800 [Xylaria arbuscula]